MIIFRVILDVLKKIHRGEIRWIAGSLAFTTVLSIVPFLALTLVTFKMIGGLDYLSPKIEAFILSYFKEAVGLKATDWMKQVLIKVQAKTIGTTAVMALFITSWRLFSDMEKGIQRIWAETNSRPLYKSFFVVWISFLLFPTLLAIYVGVRSLNFIKPIIKNYAQSIDALALFLFLYLIFYILPPGKILKRVSFISALISGIGILILQKSFTWLAKEVFYMSKFYGGLAAIPLLLVWILCLWYIVLFGAAMGASIQKNLLNR